MKKMTNIKKMFGAQDMTVGDPTSILIKFALPMLIGSFAQQLYNTVDAIVVGQFIGDKALAAVGAAGPLFNLLLALFMGVSTGAGIVVAQFFGAKNRKMLSLAVGNVMTLTFGVTILMMIIGGLISHPILQLLDTPADIIGDATSYLLIIFIGFIGCAFYNMISGVLRGMGDSLMPLVFLLLACGLNIVLDITFVACFNLGVPGVAYATIIAQAISAIFCVIRLMRMTDVIDVGTAQMRPDKKLIMKILGIGLPSGLTSAIFSCAALVVQSLTNSFGTAIIATSTVVMRVDGFAMMPNFTLGMAMTTYVGQNIGAQKMDRVNGSAKVGLKISLTICTVIVLCLLLFSKGLIMVFTNTTEVIDLGVRMIRLMAVGYIAVALTQTLMGIMRGAGDTITPMIISIISTVAIRVPVAYGVAYLTRSDTLPNGAPESIFISLVVSWVAGAVITVLFYRLGKWKKKVATMGLDKEDEIISEVQP
jgi:putative MATE family efflux protein